MTPIAFSLLLAVALSSALAGYVLRHRETPAVRHFAMLVVCVAVWCAAAAAEIVADTVETKILFSRIAYLGIALLPCFFLLFALDYTGWIDQRRKRFVLPVFLLPAATLVIVWTNSMHGLMWSEVDGVVGSQLVVDHGPWYAYVHTPYSWLLVLIGEVALVRHLSLVPSFHRAQCLVLVVATLIPMFAHLLYAVGITPLAGVDPTPLAFNLAAVFVVWGLFSFRFLDVNPVDYEMAFRSIDDAVILLDDRSRVSLANPAALERLGRTQREILGNPVGEVLERWSDSLELIEKLQKGAAVALEQEPGKPELQLRVFPLHDYRGGFRGRVLLLQEVTQQGTVGRLEEMAYKDFLTGLSNRHAFHERAEKLIALARRTGRSAAVIILDLDGFKEVNDSLGHSAGDLLLDLVGSRLSTQVSSGDLLARLGGDEFALLVLDCSTEEATHTVHRMVRAIKHEKFEVKGAVVSLDVSAGIAVFPDAGETVDELLGNADAAMYQAKQGIGGLCFYDPEQDTYTQELHKLEQEVRLALDNKQLMFHYQPIQAMDSGVITCIEALVRWQHPEKGLTQPATFLPKLKERGLSRELDRHILKLVLGETRDCPWPVAVNLSTESVVDPRLPRMVKDALLSTGFEADHLILEISEQGLAHPERARPILLALREQGVRIAADDFGMGYSSLTYLHHFPLDFLKLDRYLVAGIGSRLEDEAIIRAVLTMARSLSVDVIAEGVEEPAQLEWLASEGCKLAQGYLVARPAPLAELLAARLGRAQKPTQTRTSGRHDVGEVPSTRVAVAPSGVYET